MTSRRFLSTIAALMIGGLSVMFAQGPPVPNRADVQITPLGINSSDDDFAPVVLRGGQTIVFTSARSGEQRLWRSERTSSGWDLPGEMVPALENTSQAGTAALTPDGSFMIFAAYEWDGPDSLRGYGRTDLYSAELAGGVWTNIRNLGPEVNSSYWDSQPTLSVDGRTIFFASDRPGGRGGTDIYTSTRTASGWTRPVNLGDPVNTQFDEMTPSIAPDSKSLFFSSTGHGGAGGFDLFVAKGGSLRGTGWNQIENMGTPINSGGNEHYFISIPNSQNSYFASDRGGDLDIYTAVPNPFPPEALVTVSGVVRDRADRTPIAADITVTDLSSGEVVANYRTDGQTGNYYVVLARGRRYSITATAPDYIFYSDEYSVPPTAQGQDLKRDIDLSRLGQGTTRLLVFFDFDKADLKNESKPDLSRAIEFLRQNPNIRVEIAGHTDSVGNESYNKKLSQSRSESVRQYLVQGGIDAGRMIAKGYGEEQPIADNGTEEGRARNRRVEMRVRE